MTTAQIAKAIDYITERTETALKRLETGGKVVRDERGHWAALVTATGDIYAGLWYSAIFTGLSVVTLPFLLKETAGKPLTEV